jgi:hypothetical protein
VKVQVLLPAPTKNALLSVDKSAFFNDVCLRQMMLAPPMMTASLMMCALRHIGANIASLRNEVEQHHFGRSEKHHIAEGDASFSICKVTP